MNGVRPATPRGARTRIVLGWVFFVCRAWIAVHVFGGGVELGSLVS